MTGQRRFDPAELHMPGEADPTPAEQADALATARDLEALAADTGIRPTHGFEDRVMAAIAAEPAPRLVVAPRSTARGGVVGAFLLTVRRSWAVGTGSGRPLAVRGQALAFILLVVLAAGALTGVTAVTVGALLTPNGSTIGPDRSAVPTAPAAPVTSEIPTPGESPTPEVTASPTESAEPVETAEPTETARPARTAKPRETPRATRAPQPTEAPEGTDDHGGGSGGSGSDDGGVSGGEEGPG